MKNIRYVGCDDAELDLFESQYELPQGMCYNSYVVLGEEKVAVMDSVDARCCEEWLGRVEEALDGRTPDYLVCQHMEPDHSGSMAAFLANYPQATVLCSKQAVTLMKQFRIEAPNVQIVAEGECIDLGGLSLQFLAAPMIHWPEVIMTYCPEEQVLFSADAFGKFGVYHADEDDWACEARRYYFNIVGKYGVAVTSLLKKLTDKPIVTIAPLHGPMLEGEKKDEALRLYGIWSAYGVETEGVLVAYASIHGNTAKAAEQLAEILKAKGAGKVAITDLSRDDMAEAIEDAFRMNRLVLCCATYDGDIFPAMHLFLHKLRLKAYQNRRVALVENGSWAPQAVRVMKEMLAGCKNVEIVEPTVTIRGALKPEQTAELEDLVEALLK
ncbi:MAG: FprA family A-type flavoprotein [Bacteroidales bacterium]|nr:FprA family A-type flavoprotein [Bacteroidales bacterium]MDY6406131.1 FprA family A-type flavoprotein [Bacteroidales bacterium]